MNSTTVETPDAELLIATGCAHCGSELEALTRLLKEGLIGELRISNIVPRPQRAEELGVRSVPWLRLGPFVLEGQHSETELRHWAERANHIDGDVIRAQASFRIRLTDYNVSVPLPVRLKVANEIRVNVTIRAIAE